MNVYEPVGAERGHRRFKLYRRAPLSLTAVLPYLANLGVEVVDERPYGLTRSDGSAAYIYDFGLRRVLPEGSAAEQHPELARELFSDAFAAAWRGRAESDGFDRLVLAGCLTWRQVMILRAYGKYVRQIGTTFSQDYLEQCLSTHSGIAVMLVHLFEQRFDPDPVDPDSTNTAHSPDEAGELLVRSIRAALDDVESLDHDRILRAFLGLILATTRTNYFTSQQRPCLALKLDPRRAPDLPEPRPDREIFVYSPEVEGVHLRFGAVARGGLRWSDRREDFRTEVLGLVKAQMVKNAVIVPTGAKGGFVGKQLPDQASDREAWLAAGIRCYRIFISGLLDLTDNLVPDPEGTQRLVPPERVVRHDGDDAYLVVAADKGTAAFSDIANEVAADYGFWLGDAFASGGSVGYDHKAMGITARGAWESVKRHFREFDRDVQTEEFTVVGIGDMSGDVFGNGMLLSPAHPARRGLRPPHIFLDPDPDAATSYAERKRLFELPRSSWQDYDTDLHLRGRRRVVPRRSSRSRSTTPYAARSGSPTGSQSLTPAELMRAILLAPVDLLWNGGIGTYVKSSAETHARRRRQGQRRHPRRRRGPAGPVRGRGRQPRAHPARPHRVRPGRRGPDQHRRHRQLRRRRHLRPRGQHQDPARQGRRRRRPDRKQRNELLAEMTDEVAELVLRDNYEQNLALANASAHAAPLLHVHEDWMKQLEQRGVLNRDLEALPTSRQVRRRLDRGQGLSVPELSVLLAWTKIVLADELLASDLPDDPYLREDLLSYFPERMHADHVGAMEEHPLRRQIIVTQVVNDLVNGAGMTFWPRLAGETGAIAGRPDPRQLRGPRDLRLAVPAPGDRVVRQRGPGRAPDADADRDAHARRAGVAVAGQQPSTSLDSQATVDFFRERVQSVMAELPGIMSGREADGFEARRDRLTGQDVPEELATRVAVLSPAYALLGIVETAEEQSLEPAQVARVHFALGERLGLPALVDRIFALPRDDKWQTMARATLRDDLYAVHQQLTAAVLSTTDADDSAAGRVAEWEDADAELIGRAAATLDQICRDEADLARLSVGLRVVRTLLTR